MATTIRGTRLPECGTGRARLSVRDPSIESLLAGLDFDGENLDQLRAWSKALWRSRNAWDIGQRQSGLLGGRLRRADADRALRMALGALKGGDV